MSEFFYTIPEYWDPKRCWYNQSSFSCFVLFEGVWVFPNKGNFFLQLRLIEALIGNLCTQRQTLRVAGTERSSIHLLKERVQEMNSECPLHRLFICSLHNVHQIFSSCIDTYSFGYQGTSGFGAIGPPFFYYTVGGF